jgi:cytochrome c oxidase subunit 4
VSIATIWRCWIALILLLAATTTLAFVPLGTLNLFVALAIAIAKALIVLLFFMELRAGRPLVRTFAGAGFFWLLIFIVLTSADYLHRTDTRTPIDQTP